MKNLFLYTIDSDGKIYFQGAPYITKRTEAENDGLVDAYNDLYYKIRRRAVVPFWIMLLKYIATAIALCMLISFLSALTVKSFDVVIKDSLPVLLIGLLGAIAAVLLFFLERSKKKNAYKNEEVKALSEVGSKLFSVVNAEFGVPDSAAMIDVLCSYVKTTNKGYKPIGVSGASRAMSYYVFIQNNSLCFSNRSYLMSIPLEAVKAVELVNQKINFSDWNKPEGYLCDNYKGYKIKQNAFAVFSVKPYYKIVIEIDNEKYFVNIPPYEKEVIAAILGEGCFASNTAN